MTKKQIIFLLLINILLLTTGFFIDNKAVKIIVLTISLSLFLGLIFSTVFKNIGAKKTLAHYENDLKK